MTVLTDEGSADNQSKYRSAMVTTTGTGLPPMLRKTCPYFRGGAEFEGMCPDSDDTMAIASIGAALARLLKKNRRLV